MKFSTQLLLSALAFTGLTRAAFACESCALYLARHTDRPGFSLTTAHQFTRLGSLWEGDHRLGNPIDQFVDSQITQLTLGYTRGGNWQTQFTLPYISRSFFRPDHSRTEQGRERGVGDATLAGRYRIWSTVAANGDEFAVSVIGGVEFGTGDSDRLKPASHVHHHFTPSGIHEHDLALGSGSTDWLVGVDASWRHGRFFAHASVQRKLNRPGAFAYRYADETSWELAGGGYVLLKHEHSLMLQALFTADRRGLDSLAGAIQDDTGIRVRYLGARVIGTLGRRFEADAALELPVSIRTSDTMIVPDYRIRAAASWRF